MGFWRDENGKMRLYDDNDKLVLQVSDNGTIQDASGQSIGGGSQTLAQTLALGASAGGVEITNGADPAAAQSLATKHYVDTTSILAASLDTDGTLTANSDAKVASQKAVKTYVDAHGGGSQTLAVNQVAHGLSVNNLVRCTGVSTWVASQADAAVDSDVDGVVTSVVDANNFVVTLPGPIVSGYSALTAGADYFADPTSSGGITAVEPSVAGRVSVPVAKAISATQAIFKPQRGLVIPPAAITYVPVKIVDDATSVAAGETKFGFTVTSDLNGLSLSDVLATVTVAPTGTGLSFGVRKRPAGTTGASDVEMLSTNSTIDVGKVSSTSSATQRVIKSDGSQIVHTDDIVFIDCDQADSNAVSRGSFVRLGIS